MCKWTLICHWVACKVCKAIHPHSRTCSLLSKHLLRRRYQIGHFKCSSWSSWSFSPKLHSNLSNLAWTCQISHPRTVGLCSRSQYNQATHFQSASIIVPDAFQDLTTKSPETFVCSGLLGNILSGRSNWEYGELQLPRSQFPPWTRILDCWT